MGNTLRFDPASLEAAAARLGDATAAIQQKLETLEAEAETLIGRWDGEAADAYRTAQQDWNASLRNMNSVLRSSSRAADRSAARYAAARAQVAERWG